MEVKGCEGKYGYPVGGETYNFGILYLNVLLETIFAPLAFGSWIITAF